MAQAFDDETRATMVVVAAAAFAIDALYIKIDAMLDAAVRPVFSRGVKRPGRVVETFKVALALGRQAARWQKEIRDRFDLRDELVHFRATMNESEPHPTGKSHVSREAAKYSCEQATRAVDLALEVIATAYKSPRRRHAELVMWSEGAAHVPDWLREARRRGL